MLRSTASSFSLATHPALTGPFAALILAALVISAPLSVLLNIASSGLMHRKAGLALNSLSKAEFSPPPASSAGELTPADSDFVLCIVNWGGPWVLSTPPASWQAVWEKEHWDGWFFIKREGLLKLGQSPSTSEGTNRDLLQTTWGQR